VAEPAAPCPECEIVAGRRVPPGGVVARWPGFVLHAIDGPTPVAGWLVLAPVRHVRAVFDLPDAEAARLGALAGHVLRTMKAALRAEHAYSIALGEALHHAHIHLVPRYADTPARLRGPRIFLGEPGDAVPVDQVEAAARRIEVALAGTAT
jgi:histidine triad (HIT) family protein